MSVSQQVESGSVSEDRAIERPAEWFVMRAGDLHRLVSLLVTEFDEVIGPVAEDGVIRLRPIHSTTDLPVGVTEEQETATYRLHKTGTQLRFSYGLGPDSLKAIVHPPRSPVWTMRLPASAPGLPICRYWPRARPGDHAWGRAVSP